MLFPVVDRFQSSFDTKTGCSVRVCEAVAGGAAEGFERPDVRYGSRQADADGEEPGEGDDRRRRRRRFRLA